MSADDLSAQLALENELGGEWQVYRAALLERWVRYRLVPKGHYWAAHWRLSEPPIVAADLEALAAGVRARQAEMAAEKNWAERSALDRILGDPTFSRQRGKA